METTLNETELMNEKVKKIIRITLSVQSNLASSRKLTSASSSSVGIVAVTTKFVTYTPGEDCSIDQSRILSPTESI